MIDAHAPYLLKGDSCLCSLISQLSLLRHVCVPATRSPLSTLCAPGFHQASMIRAPVTYHLGQRPRQFRGGLSAVTGINGS